MVYEVRRRQRRWIHKLRGGLKTLAIIFFTILGIGLSTSTQWLALGIPILMYTMYQIVKKNGPSVACCPYCGTRVETDGAWVLSCPFCRQRSYVRHSHLLESPRLKTMVVKH